MKKYIITVNGVKYEVAVEEADPNAVYTPAQTKEEPKQVKPAPAAVPAAAPAAAPAAPVQTAPAEGTRINAPLPGNILKVNFAVGDVCKKGDTLCILEAMKMENEISAPCGGKILSVVAKGITVNTGDLLFVIA